MASGSELKVFLAGRVAVEANGHVIDEARFPGRQGRILFAYLVAERGRPVPRDELAEAIWGDDPPATWDKAMTVLASKLRALLADELNGRSALVGAFGCYRLELPEETWVDVTAASKAAREAETALAAGDLETARRAGELAVGVARLPFLPGDDGSWVEAKRRELAEIRAGAVNTLADTCLRAGSAAEATRWAEDAVALEPYRETGYRRLMEAHVAAGNRAEALRVYERCRRLLADELGTYPSPETEAIYRGLLDGPSEPVREPGVDAPTPAGPRDTGRRKRAALVVAIVLVAGVIAAALALATRGEASPKVVPNSLLRIDPHSLKVTNVTPVGDSPDLVVDAGGFLWVTHHVLRYDDSGALRNAGDRTLTRVDAQTGKSVVVGGGLAPCGLTADPSGDVWVANCYADGTSDNVVRVDATTLGFEKTWQVPGGDGFYRGLAEGGGSLWVSGIASGGGPGAGDITQIDPVSGAEKTIHLRRPGGALAWSDGYGDLWVNNFDSGSITRLHVATDAEKVVDGVAENPSFPIVAGDEIWAGDWSHPRVVRLHAIGPARPRSISLPATSRLAAVTNLAAGAGEIWVASPDEHAIWRIDPRTDALTRVKTTYMPWGVAADANDVWVTVRGN